MGIAAAARNDADRVELLLGFEQERDLWKRIADDVGESGIPDEKAGKVGW